MCSNFTGLPCTYVVKGEVDYVVQQADDHVCLEHQYTDTPELRKQIEKSLVDVVSEVGATN